MERSEQIMRALPHSKGDNWMEYIDYYTGDGVYSDVLTTLALCSHDASAAVPQLKVLANKVADNRDFKQACSKAQNPRQWRSCVEKELPNFLSSPELVQYYELEEQRISHETECIRKGTAEAIRRNKMPDPTMKNNE